MDPERYLRAQMHTNAYTQTRSGMLAYSLTSTHTQHKLGHRSLLAYLFSNMKDRMNRLKVREWFRPVAPVFTYESREMFVDSNVRARLHHTFHHK